MTLVSAGIINDAGGSAIIDSYEDGDLSEYTYWNEDSTSEFVVTDASNLSFPAVDGSNVLEVADSGSVSYIYSLPGDGLDNYFSKGNTATFYMRQESTTDNRVSFLFGVEDEQNSYWATLQWNRFYGAKIEVQDSSGSTTLANNSNHDLNASTWYELEVTWDDGTLGGSDNDITLNVSEGIDGPTVMTLSVNDSTHAGNSGVGVRAKDKSEILYCDYAHLSG